jgi:MraZ protein
MELLTGKYKAALDEKGRINLPAPLRKALDESELFLGEGMENCLWLYPKNEYMEMLKEVKESTHPFSQKDRNIRRWLYSFQKVEVDKNKNGRIQIPQNIREIAGLSKDCIITGQYEYIEIWDEERFCQYEADIKGNSSDAFEELSKTLKDKRGAKE